jgi:ATP-dependent DNA helicase RecG
MEINFVRSLIQDNAETEWIEYKENWYDPEQLGEYISALSNGAAIKGQPFGYFVWGVQDKTRNFVGTSFDWKIDYKKEPLENYLARGLNPSLNFKFERVLIEGKTIVVLSIPKAEKYPTSFAGQRYIRIDSSKTNLRDYPHRESALWQLLTEGRPSLANTIADNQELTFEGLWMFYASKGVSLNKDTFKKNLNFLNKAGRYNKMAELLSDQNHIPFRVSVFAGKSKTDPMYSVKEYGNKCLLISLSEILSYFDAINIPQADERNRKVERKEVPLFDSDALREAVVNAVLHNLWTDENAPMVTVFSDRIEILSHGGIPFGQTKLGFLSGESVPVNKELSEIFLQLHISEKTGRGVPRIVKAFGENAFEFNENSINVTIKFRKIQSSEFAFPSSNE